jgi:hypothetical protein
MLQKLIAADVRFVVIGGVAAIVHGSPMYTRDLDICYEASDDNLSRLVDVLRSWNVQLRGAPAGLPWILDVRAVRTNPVLTLIGTEGLIDIMDRLDGVGDFAAARAASIEAEWDDLTFPVLSLDALIKAKRAAGRAKDRPALILLEALREERRKRGLD